MAKGFQRLTETIFNDVYGTYAEKMNTVDDMVCVSTSVPAQPDEYFRDCQQRIEQMDSPHARHEAYELLLGFISNNHPFGFAAPIYDEIAQQAGKNSIRP